MKKFYCTLSLLALGACVPTQPLCERPWEEYWAGQCRPQREDRDAAQPGATEREERVADREPPSSRDAYDDDDDDRYHDGDDDDDDDDDDKEDDDD